MLRSIGHRLLQFIPVLLGITLLAFGLMFIATGDPISIRLSAGGITPRPELIKAMRDEMGLNDPFLVQYYHWLMNLLQGDLGKSYITDESVATRLLEALPYTLKMATLSMVLTLVISIPLGIYIAARQNSWIDNVVRGLAFIGNAIPNFIIGVTLMYLFCYVLGWVPVLASGTPIGVVLPSLTLALVMSSRYVRQVRAATLDELSKDYVVGLRARGLSEQTILFKNVIKNIMITVITLTGISIGSLLGGTVIVETIYNWPGVGNLIMDAISKRDYPIVQATVVWMSMIFMLVNLLTDISYTWFNPKIKKI